MKLKILNKKQVGMVCVSLALVLLGYLAYLGNGSYIDENIANKIADININSETLGDVQLVSTQNTYQENSVEENTIQENKTNEETLNKDNEDNYFEESRLERNKMYSETIEVYEDILANDSISEDQKVIAENEIAAITNIRNGIVVAENLIKVKGFEDVVIFVNDATATVVVKIERLKKEHIAQIQNIITKQLSIDVKDISITNREE